MPESVDRAREESGPHRPTHRRHREAHRRERFPPTARMRPICIMGRRVRPGSLWSKPTPASRPLRAASPSPATQRQLQLARQAPLAPLARRRAPAGARPPPRAWRTTAPQPSAQLCSLASETTTTTAVDTPTRRRREASVPSPDKLPSFRHADPAPAPPPGRPFSGASSSGPRETDLPTPPSSSCSSSASSSAASSSSVVFPGAEPSRALQRQPGAAGAPRLHPGASCPRLSPPLHMAPGLASTTWLVVCAATQAEGLALRRLCQWAGGAAAGGPSAFVVGRVRLLILVQLVLQPRPLPRPPPRVAAA